MVNRKRDYALHVTHYALTGLSALINSGRISGGKDENLCEGFYCRVS